MIFFTSDHHFNHANIIKYCNRPFESTEEMNEEMIKRWNTIVGLKDEVYYLGDFSLAKHVVELIAPRLNGVKYLIMGNHDACHPCHKKKAESAMQIYVNAGFQMLGMESFIEIAGMNVRLNHMPYQMTETCQESYTPKYQNFRPKDDGVWLLHGHVHEKWKVKDRMINVGVDVWDFYPVPIDDIEKLIHTN